MTQTYQSTKNSPEDIAKRAVYLAWKASTCLGMGFLQDNPHASEEDVWECVTGKRAQDYTIPRGSPTQITCDYVFGRMMKLYLSIIPEGIMFREQQLSKAYQSWCGKYPTISNLLEHAEKSLEQED